MAKYTRLTKDKIIELHPNKSELTSAKLFITNEYIEFIFVGDCAALEMEISGDVILERQLDYTWTISNNSNKVIIFTLTKQSMPRQVFKYSGNVRIGKCLCTDWFGNSVEAFKIKAHTDTHKIIDSDNEIEDMKDFKIKDLKNKGTNKIKINRGLKVVPKRTINEYKEKKLEEKIIRDPKERKGAVKPRKTSGVPIKKGY